MESPGRSRIVGAPEGVDALCLATRGPGGRDLLHIACDDARMAGLTEALAFFAPELEVVSVPAWDCVPYDRVSPNGEITARRIDALTRLAEAPATGGRLVLTTVAAALQLVPPPEVFRDAVWRARVGEAVDTEGLRGFLSRRGYHRAGTVREPGEFAIRGGIIDVFPPGGAEPLRLDFFGDELERVRGFDPMSQISLDERPAVELKPMSEVDLDPESIRRFRQGYRELSGAADDHDPLYEAVSAGRVQVGMEHWLPLFHQRLVSLFDYLPDAAVTLDSLIDEAVAARLEQIADYYEARRSIAAAPGDGGAPPYKPVPPGRLFLTREGFEGILDRRPVATFSPFSAPAAGDGIDLEGRPAQGFADVRTRPGGNLFDAVARRFQAEREAGRRVVVAAYSAGSRDRLRGLMERHGLKRLRAVDSWTQATAGRKDQVALVVLGLERGFATPELALFSEQDILGDRLVRPSRRRRRADQFIAEVSTLQEGDLVVHLEHGIGRYQGLEALNVAGAPHDCLRLHYAGGDRLYLPVENIDMLSRFGTEDAGVGLDRLGSAAWQALKSRIKKRIREIAQQLIDVAAQRQLRPGETIPQGDGAFEEFCAGFPFPETEDQLGAIADTMRDLASGRPMDRLICGDVGFGKTEVILRAAFTVAMHGGQVAVVVPTTLLCRQHFQTFRERLAGLPIHIEQLSRLATGKPAARVKQGLADGTVDVVIGTHALLAKSVAFRRLMLLVVDEEQHFGVAQKERLKQLMASVHVLTLSATPIPRTLQMALAGVKEMSLIATPPVDRLAVRTFVLPWDPVIVREAILRERLRGGQSFYVCPRVKDLPEVRERLGKLVPEVKIAVAHGQMPASRLEQVIGAYYDGAVDLLLCTNIIDSGLDIPNANTLIVHRADRFGLAQLYQLRGRVGRAKRRAYAYLTLAPRGQLTPAAQKRLEVMQTLDTLGAGFQLAGYDLDIRGAGNLLGEEQSGQIREVGVDLYQQMLEEAVAAARGGGEADVDRDWTPQISIGSPVLIPDSYVADLEVRLGLYRRIAPLVDRQEIDAFAAELIDRFGPLPEEVENLLEIVAIKRLCRDAGVAKLDAGPKGAVIAFRNNRFANPEGLAEFLGRQAGTVKLRPDHRLIYRRDWTDPRTRIQGVERLIIHLGEIAAAAG